MKTSITFLFLCLFVISSKAQQPVTTYVTQNPFPKTISVTGSAEIEIIPDEIYVQVSLREYEKKGTGKIELEKIKTDFLNTCKVVGLSDSLISIASYQGYDRYYWKKKKKKDPDLFASINYQIKFRNPSQIDALVDKLDDDATQNFSVTRTAHSRIQEYRQQLKMQAVKAAKEKAIYLTEAINEKLGEAITLEEPKEEYGFRNVSQETIYITGSSGKNAYNDEVAAPTSIDFQKIKLKMDVKVLFALK